ncbi:hypothetical protein KKC62_00820 [Patescibacteria group bacterium]|nr:hypothetical protein [Patescibacteria group bacterium]
MKPFNKSRILEKVSNIVPVLMAFLVPIFFLPTSTEFFSFNKFALITVVVILLILIWALKTITGKKIEIIESMIDTPLLILVGVVVLSTVFSVSKTNSIWGTQGRWLGLVAFLVIGAYYYLTTPALKSSKIIKYSLLALVVSSTISSMASTLSYYKIYLSSLSLFRIQNFSFTGSIKDAIMLAVLAITISLGLAIYSRSKPLRIALAASVAINFFFIAITGSLLGWAMLITGVLSIIFFADKSKLFSEKIVLIGFLVITLPTVAAILIPRTKGLILDKTYITEYMLPAKESWFIATSTIQDYPMLATGPSTFDLNFTRYKPLSLNATELWDRKFDKPYNELFNILGTIGIVGVLAVALFVVKTVKFTFVTSKEVKDENGFSIIASSLTIAILVSFLFTYASVLTTFLLFFAIGLMVGVNSFDGDSKYTKSFEIEYPTLTSIIADDKTATSNQYIKYVMSIPAFLLAGFLGYLSFRNYAGEYYMRRSLVAISNNNSADAYYFQGLAIRSNPKRDVYYDYFAQTNLAIANALAAKKDLTDADKQNIQTLVSQAISNIRLATETINPLNVDNWEIRAIIYKSIMSLAQNASDWAIGSYNTAIQLDPTNARFRVDLGGIYFANKDYLSAANQFRQATSLKSDYANAHFNFALALIELKEYDLAKRELDITKLLLPVDSEDAKVVDSIIAQLPTPPATEEPAKPTVEQLSGVGAGIPQEPLVNPGETETQNLNPQVIPQQ